MEKKRKRGGKEREDLIKMGKAKRTRPVWEVSMTKRR
jgi:hypothetical protein